MSTNNYSYSTSYPAYLENESGKNAQETRVLRAINSLKGKATLKQLEKILKLPQSTISGRVNDLVKAKKVKYSGEVFYEGRTRKQIISLVYDQGVNYGPAEENEPIVNQGQLKDRIKRTSKVLSPQKSIVNTSDGVLEAVVPSLFS